MTDGGLSALSRGSVSRRGLLVLGAGSFAAGCSSSDRTEKLPASDLGKPVEGGVQDRLRRPVPSALTRTADLQTGRGLPRERGLSIPHEIRYPPTGVATPLVSSPPGRVRLKLEVYNSPAPEAHFMTDAGEWRIVQVPDLGLPPGFRSLWRDSWSGSVSPNGRFWGFPIYHDARAERRVAVVDFETLEMRPVRAPRFDPYGWTTDSDLVLDGPTVDGVQRMRVLDPRTGRIRRYRMRAPRPIGNPIHGPDGAVRFTRTKDWREGLTAIEYGEDFTKVGETRLPVSFGRDIWAPTALSSRHVVMGIQVRQHGRRSTGVLIADRNWTPQALLLDRGRGHPPTPHWIAPDVLLLHHGMAMHSATAVLRYDCRSGSLTRVATVEAPSDPRTGLLFDFARDLLHG